MPPHARMSLAQQLLLRALVARFWAEPYRPARLARWGTELHDRFMLPHFVWQDLADVVAELHGAGYPFELDWFAPHLEFRFPLLGDFAAARRRRRAAHGARAVARARRGERRRRHRALRRLVRSSACRCKATGLVGDRYVLTCNGRRVPLQPTGTAGEFVAGVRYRAWPPPSSLHPTIAVHAPLTFDLVDTWMSRSLGGCQYHVAHPGGRNYTTFPVNALRGRGAPPGALLPHRPHAGHAASSPAESANPDFPFTLDLRRPRVTCTRVRSLTRRVDAAINCSPATRRPTGRFDELLDAPGAAARALGRVPARARRAQRARGRATRSRSPSGRSARTASPTTSTPTRRARSARGSSTRCRSILPADEWAAIDAGIAQRADLLNRVLGDLYGAADAAEERRDPAAGDLRPPRLPASAAEALRPAGRPPPAAVRGRPGALARRPLVGRRRPHAGAVGLGLRAREPARRLARLPADVPRAAGAAPRAVLRRAARVAAALGAARRRADRASSCSRRARTTRPTSSTRCSRATSASRWSRAATSRCATTASG